jgi:VanZ family protein
MALIAVFSSSLFGVDRTGGLVQAILGWLLPGAAPATLAALHAVARKLGHVTEYAVLALLWLRALRPERLPGGPAGWTVVLCVAYAGLDEARQGLAPNRSPSIWDVALDTAGAVLGTAWGGGLPRLALAGQRLARWAAGGLALASLLAAGLELALGLPAWDLLVAAGGLGALAWGLTRRPPPPAGAPPG